MERRNGSATVFFFASIGCVIIGWVTLETACAAQEGVAMGSDTITGPDTGAESGEPRLSSAKREDIWALIIALVVLVLALLAPDAVHSFFKNGLYFL